MASAQSLAKQPIKKITVIGTKGDQPAHLHNRLGGSVDLICIEADKLHRSSMSRNSDYVILWSKFLPHRHREMVLSVLGPHRMLEVFGGLDELAERIRNLAFRTAVEP